MKPHSQIHLGFIKLSMQGKTCYRNLSNIQVVLEFPIYFDASYFGFPLLTSITSSAVLSLLPCFVYQLLLIISKEGSLEESQNYKLRYFLL